MGNYYVGLDAGSTYLKAALIKDNCVLGAELLPTGIDCCLLYTSTQVESSEKSVNSCN